MVTGLTIIALIAIDSRHTTGRIPIMVVIIAETSVGVAVAIGAVIVITEGAFLPKVVDAAALSGKGVGAVEAVKADADRTRRTGTANPVCYLHFILAH